MGYYELIETEEIPIGKPKRKIWKLVVPAIIVAILIPSLMYAYAYFALYDAWSKSWDTFEYREGSLPDIETLYQGTEVFDEVIIRNPTGTSIRLVKVNYDSWVDGKKFGTIRETNKYLPAGGSITLTLKTYIDSEIMNIVLSPYYERKTRWEVVYSTSILFITVTRTFFHEDVETIFTNI